MTPYRAAHPSPYDEEELWLRLDCALEVAIRDKSMAWRLAWWVVQDGFAADFKEVMFAAAALLDVLEPYWDLD